MKIAFAVLTCVFAIFGIFFIAHSIWFHITDAIDMPIPVNVSLVFVSFIWSIITFIMMHDVSDDDKKNNQP